MEPIKLTYTILPGDLSRAGEASSQMRMALRQLGIPPEIIRRASVCMYEGEINMVIHANGGQIDVLIGMDDIILRLADEGPGIPDDQLDSIWERYYKIDKEHKRAAVGSGLGLSIVKTILSMHNATYGVASSVGKGSVFWFELPLLAE